VSVRPKHKTHAIELDAEGALTTERGIELEVPDGWTPEHLVLAALARCSVNSLEHHARRRSLGGTTASASGVVAPREADDVWAFVEIECGIEAHLEPAPSADGLRKLLGRAERGCFVGSSLTAKPRYRWTVNGERVS
jgi:organic hydroperoxide reductase OsmC/OhrA